MPERKGFLRERDQCAVEEMDRPGCDAAMLERTYAQFPLINAVVSGWRSMYKERIKPLLAAQKASDGPVTLLDIGSGGGDVVRSLARWAARDGFALLATGLDPDERAFTFACAQPSVPGVTYRSAHSNVLVAEGASFDIIVSNHVLHHLSAPELQGLLVDTEALSPKLALHADIARHRIGYALFSASTLPFFPGSFIRRDGLTSIRRSYTRDELAAAVPPLWRVEEGRPFRLILTRGAGHG